MALEDYPNLQNISKRADHKEVSAKGGHNSSPTKRRIRDIKKITQSLAKASISLDDLPEDVHALLKCDNPNGKYDTAILDAYVAKLFAILLSGGKGAVEAAKLIAQYLGEDIADKQEVKIVYDKDIEDLMG